MLFGGPKARILRVLRSDPRLPRRLAKTIVFNNEIRTIVGRKKCAASLSLRKKRPMCLRKSSLWPVRAICASHAGPRKDSKIHVFSKAERNLEKLVKYVLFRHQNAITVAASSHKGYCTKNKIKY